MSILEEIEIGENKKIEFKAYMPTSDKIMKTAVAFSNCAGGKLIIGIEDNGTINGISDDDIFELPDKISNIIYDGCYPTIIPEIYTERIYDKLVLVVEFYPGNIKPYYIKSKKKSLGVYVRIGATNKQADDNMIFELERQKRNISLDEEIAYDIGIENIDIDKLKKDFEYITDKKLSDSDIKNFKLIKIENGQEYATNGLILLSSNKSIFEYARIKCARFKGMDVTEFIDQKEYDGPLYEQVENAINFIKMYVEKSGKIEELQRKDKYAIPLIAVREALVNAVVHRDYSILGADIKIAIFDDRIEITSPGSLPKSLDINDINDGRSEVRNKVIARFFREIGYIEQWGTGIRRIISECEKEGLLPPVFKESGNFFKVIIYKKTDKRPIKTDKQIIIINYIKENGSIVNKQARELIGLKDAAVKRILSDMVRKDILEAIGEGKGRYYILKDVNEIN